MEKPSINENHLNRDAELPYGLTVTHVKNAMQAVYDYYHEVNEWHLAQGYGRFGYQFRANNAIGDFLGHRMTIALADECDGLKDNKKTDGRPDLLEASYPKDRVKDKSAPGVELKFSQKTGFDSHNAVDGWAMLVRYEVNQPFDEVPSDEVPFRIRQILCAETDPDEYVDHPSPEDSDRTNTSNPTKYAMHDLRSSPVYERPEHMVHHPQHPEWGEQYREQHAEFNPEFDAD